MELLITRPLSMLSASIKARVHADDTLMNRDAAQTACKTHNLTRSPPHSQLLATPPS